MVLHEDGVVIKPPEAGRAEEMRQAVAARFELAITDALARSRHHDGGLIGARLGVLAWIHVRILTRRGPSSNDAALAPLPIPLAQRALIELAGRQARQLSLEIDRARAFVMGEIHGPNSGVN